MSDMMFHDHNECMRTYYNTERKTQLGQVAGKAKHIVNYDRYTDIPSGDVRAVLGLCAVTAAALMYYGALMGL